MNNSPLILVLLLFVFTGCDMAYFDRIPGEKVETIPEMFQGEFNRIEFSIDANEESDENIKYTIDASSWTEFQNEPKTQFLSDSAILSKYRKYYFLSIKEDKGYGCMVIEKTKKGFLLCPILVDDNMVPLLKKIFPKVEELNDGSDDYIYIEMSEKKLLKFYKKQARKSYHFVFEKITSE